MYFLHRIQQNDGTFTKGIETHENLDDAIRSFWGRVKTGYNNPQNPDMTFVRCKITDESGNVVSPYSRTWLKDGAEETNVYFLHHIRVAGEDVTKAIDIYETKDEAMVAFASEMEYGYNNPKFPDVTMVFCEITDLLSGDYVHEQDKWVKVVEPEPVPEPEKEAAE